MLFDDEDMAEDDFFPAEAEEEGSGSPGGTSTREELKVPRQQSSLIGHKDVEARLLELMAANRLGQSLIFTGPAGTGKSTFAYRLAKYM